MKDESGKYRAIFWCVVFLVAYGVLYFFGNVKSTIPHITQYVPFIGK